MIELAVFDVDGTLLSPITYQVPQSAVRAIEDLQEQGIKVAIASGRPIHALQNITNAGIHPDYVVGCNGHMVHDETGKLIAGACFTYDQVEQLTQFCLQNDYALMWKFSQGNYIYHGLEEVRKIHKKLEIPAHLSLDCSTCDHHKEELPFGAVMYAPQEVVDRYVEEVDPGIVFLPFEKDRYDVSLKGVNKGTGLKQLLDAIGLTLDECIAFGDAINDLEMIEEVGIGVAMQQCDERLLAVADYHAEDLHEDGLAKALYYFGLIDEIKK
ncbi:MAG: HAD family hydrolase [Erysipelotrichaceae bacterium]|nr:HAD family hydrolase [Erysipelotrichaceae bacterium]